MDEPLICCILPYHIPDYVLQAFMSFYWQSHRNKRIIVMDTSDCRDSIGSIRNALVDQTPKGCIIAHWDADDWSSPLRLASQVELLTKNNINVTGYHDLPFYDVANDRVVFYQSNMTGYAVGTSLMYRREVWEKTPFPDKSMGEDASWQHAVKREQGHPVVSTSSVIQRPGWIEQGELGRPDPIVRMVARHHAGCVSEAQEQPRSKQFGMGDNYRPASAELDRAVRACIGAPISVR